MKSKTELLRTALNALKPIEKTDCAKFAEKYFVLPSTSAEPGKYRLERTPYAEEILKAFTQPNIQKVVVMSSSQVGKALDINTPIATADGWKLMRDLQVGDKVFDERGELCNVTFVTGEMHDRKCYKVTFSDGAEIIADAEHNWFVQDSKSTHNRKERILTTEEIFETYKIRDGKKMRNRYAVPVAMPLKLPERELPIKEYAFGAWAGDGDSGSFRISMHKDDIEVARRIEKDGYKIVSVRKKGNVRSIRFNHGNYDENLCIRGHDLRIVGRNKWGQCLECNRQRDRKNAVREPILESQMTLRHQLNKLGVLNNKHIPQIYLRSSREQRLELLRGLMDTDGTVNPRDGRCMFVQKNKRLADDVMELIRTLGFKPTMRAEKVSREFSNGDTEAVYWRIGFVAYKDTPVFNLQRKIDKQWDRTGKRTEDLGWRRIVKVEQVASRPVKCIAVDSPSHLYLAGREMIPTHNTSIMLIVLARFICIDPCNCLLVLPTLELAQDISKDRIESMIRDCPILTPLFYEDGKKSRDKNQTILSKFFKGGRLSLVGANSPTGLSSRPIRLLLCDEVDRFASSAGTEGDPIALAETRQSTYWNKITGLFSTPTIENVSRIEAEYKLGTQEEWSYQCGNCGEWHGINYEDITEQYKYRCPDCGWEFTEQEVKNFAQKYIAHNPTAEGVRSFTLNAFSSPWLSWAAIMKEWADARGNPEREQTVYNTKFGRSYALKGEFENANEFLKNREEYEAEIPARVAILTAAVDVQANRLEYEIVGWNREERWGIMRGVIVGAPALENTWHELDLILDRVYYKRGGELRISRVFVDSGYSARVVYNYCRTRLNRFPVKGKGGAGIPFTPSWRYPKNSVVPVGIIGVNDGKQEVFGRLKIKPGEEYYWHYPHDDKYFRRNYDEIYFKQLFSEKRVIKKAGGVQYIAWEPLYSHIRNESLDLAVYNLAAIKSMNVDWDAQIKTKSARKIKKSAAIEIY